MATSVTKAIEYVHIHLLKKGTAKAALAVESAKPLNWKRANQRLLPGGNLCFHAPPPTTVGWRAFLLPGFGGSLPDFKSQHASAVLFFTVKRRIFAVTFGYGRTLLSERCLEADFGLKTALKLCKEGTLKAVDYRTIEERTRIGRIQLSEEAPVGAFGMDLDTDLLRGLEAMSKDKSVCERLAARWASLTVGARIELKDLPGLASRILDIYEHGALPREFRWIDNVHRITDPGQIGTLDTLLKGNLDGGTHANIRLALPEITGEGIAIDAKLFKADGPEFDSDVGTYLAARPRRVGDTITAAKTSHHVLLLDSANHKVRLRIPVYRCLVAELVEKDQLYLLADGEWFALNKGFVTTINKAVNRIRTMRHKWPAWKTGEREDRYNKRACKAWAITALLDKANISIGGGHSTVEPADLATTGRVLGYVKRRDKNSSGLSHAFSQGMVSATLMTRDRDFRRALAARLPTSHGAIARELRAAGFDARQWTIAYVILGADATQPAASLPFFSKVNLKKHVQQLEAMQYDVRLIGV